MSDEIPLIKITQDKPECSKRVEKIFDKLELSNVPKELINIRKEQLKEHSNCNYICDAYEGLINMIGQRDNQESRLRIAQYKKELIHLHTPFYIELPFFPQCSYGEEAWREWTLWELYDNYFTLCMEQLWDDFYSLNKMNGFKNYQVLDMLNDLLVHEKIYGYEAVAFISGVEDLLNDFKEDMKIPVKIIQ